MSVLETAGLTKYDFLRTLYELSHRTAKRAVAFVDAELGSGLSGVEADEACDFWADRGVVEFTSLGRIALTHLGLRKAARLAERGWYPPVPF